MAMGKRKREPQQELWIAATDVPQGPGHPSWQKFNGVFSQHGFGDFVEDVCRKFCHETLGRPGIPPGVYFQMRVNRAWNRSAQAGVGSGLGLYQVDVLRVPPRRSDEELVQRRPATEYESLGKLRSVEHLDQ